MNVSICINPKDSVGFICQQANALYVQLITFECDEGHVAQSECSPTIRELMEFFHDKAFLKAVVENQVGHR